MAKIMRIRRTLEYYGPKEWIDQVFSHNYATPTGPVCGTGRYVREVDQRIVEVLEIEESEAFSG